MAIEDWARQYRVKNSEIRKINGRHYLYKIGSKWDPIKKKAKKITIGLLGVITQEDGFIPKGQSRRGRPPKDKESRNISNKEFGASYFLESISSDIISALKEIYPNDWETIFALSVSRLVNQGPLMHCESLFEESFLSEKLSEARLGKNNLTELLKNVGEDRELIVKFMKRFIQGKNHIAFDTTHLISHSESLESAEFGYNSTHDYDPQVNLFYMFSVDKQMPTYYKMFPGNIGGVSAFKNCLVESGLEDCMVIGDKGFYSEKNLEFLDELGLKYILPLMKTNKLIEYERLEFAEEDTYFKYQGRIIFYVCLEEKNGKKIIIFMDELLRGQERINYINNIEQQKEGYDMSKFKEKKLKFGTISMITNDLEAKAEEVYTNYKTRMRIEALFDTYKNVLEADKSYMRSDESMEGWLFINHIATMMYYRIFVMLKKSGELKTVSPKYLLERLSHIQKMRINGRWIVSEITSKTEELLKKIGISIPIY